MSKFPEVLGHWHTFVENFSTSSLDFYDEVRKGIAKREIPNLDITTVEWKESGLASGKRVYLRLSREYFTFDICAAPFGTGYFFSSWLVRIPSILLDLGFLFAVLFLGVLVSAGFAGREGGPGCGIFLVPLFFLGLLLLLGCYVRYGDHDLEPTVHSMPVTGFLYRLVFRPPSYFNEDTAIMFREFVQLAVVEAVEAVTSAQGIRLPPEAAREIAQRPGTLTDG